MNATTQGAQPKKSFRDYDRERMHRLASCMYEALFHELRSPENVVVMPVREIMDASALVIGMLLAPSPHAKVNSQLRELCDLHAKDIAKRTREAIASGETIADLVLSDEDTVQ